MSTIGCASGTVVWDSNTLDALSSKLGENHKYCLDNCDIPPDIFCGDGFVEGDEQVHIVSCFLN